MVHQLCFQARARKHALRDDPTPFMEIAATTIWALTDLRLLVVVSILLIHV
jgi:hypothetical protein